MGIDIRQLSPAAQAQIAQKLAAKNREKLLLQQEAEASQKANKYHAQKDNRGELKFDSKKEARRYDELMLRLMANEIKDLKLQRQYTLQESYITPDGIRVRAIRYVADFTYFDLKLNREVVEDTKSRATATPVYKMKKKMMLERLGIEIVEV